MIRFHPKDIGGLIKNKDRYQIDLRSYHKIFLEKLENDQEFKLKYPTSFKNNMLIDKNIAYKEWLDFIYKNRKNPKYFSLINNIHEFKVDDFITENSSYEELAKLKKELINEVTKVDFSKKSLLVFVGMNVRIQQSLWHIILDFE